MTTLFRQPSLRPALRDLPPTLQPHAVLSLAPPTDRRRSAALSAAVYALLAGGVILLAKAAPAIVAHPPMDLHPVVILDPGPTVAPSQPHPVSTPKTPPVTQVVPPVAPPIPTDAPSQLPTTDHSQDPPSSPVPSTAAAAPGSGGEPISVSMDALRVLRQVDPRYPPMAKMAHLQGQVVLRMTIDDQGVPAQVDAVSGPAGLRASALDAARQWRFEPARQDGQAVPATFLLTLNFVLR